MKAIKIATPNGDYRVKDGALQFRPRHKRRFNAYSTDARFGLGLMLETWQGEALRLSRKMEEAQTLAAAFRQALSQVNAGAS